MNNNSAKKRERQNKVRRMRNRQVKSSIRTAVRKFDEAVVANDKDVASSTLKECFKIIDSAKSKGVLHSNTASRKKARLHAKFNKMA